MDIGIDIDISIKYTNKWNNYLLIATYRPFIVADVDVDKHGVNVDCIVPDFKNTVSSYFQFNKPK